MSTETTGSNAQETPEMATKPVPEHAWLNHLIGEWRIETEMLMDPNGPKLTATGRETVKSLGGLWAYTEGTMTMPDGTPMIYVTTLGYDVSFKEYRACWFASVSSHLWKYTGALSTDGKTMTLSCTGPNMMIEGETANYRDVIEIIDADHRTMTSFAEDENGVWQEYVTSRYTRI